MKHLIIFIIESILLFIYLIGILLLLDNPTWYIMWIIAPWIVIVLLNINEIKRIIKKFNS